MKGSVAGTQASSEAGVDISSRDRLKRELDVTRGVLRGNNFTDI